MGTSETARRVRAYLPEGQGFNQSNLSHYRAGRAMPRLSYLEALSRALGVEPTELIGMDDTLAGPAASSDIRIEPMKQDNAPRSTTCASELPALRVEDRGDQAHIQLSQTLPWPTVLKILQALKVESTGAE